MTARRAPRVAAAPRGSLAIAVVGFCRLLLRWGVRLPADSAQTALATLAVVDITRRYDFRTALRVSLLTRPEDFQTFDYLFNAFWRADGKPAAVAEEKASPTELESAAPEEDPELSDGAFNFEGIRETAEGASNVTRDDATHFMQAAPHGLQARHAPKKPDDPADMARLARALAAQLASRRSRRYESHPRGKSIDLRGTLRRSLRYGGIPIELGWRRPQLARAQLVIFCDVSRSMTEYTQLFLRFAAAVMRRVWHVEIFLFATELRRVTEHWRDQQWSEIESAIPGCGGGTQLGTSLATFFKDYDRCLAGQRTTAIILSDGLDGGDSQMITQMMQRLQRETQRILWLNPLLRVEGYEPIARGMAAALPFVDVFASAHDTASLWALVDTLAEHRGRR